MSFPVLKNEAYKCGPVRLPSHFNSRPAGQIMKKIGMNTIPLEVTQISQICGTAPTKIQ
jgi:hypothetical protein